MGCPVPKVTKKGGGAALPWKQDLFQDILESAVNTSNKVTSELGVKKVPVTVKMRMGIDDEHLTYIEAGKIAAKAPDFDEAHMSLTTRIISSVT